MAFRENNAVIEEMGSIIRVEFESFLMEKENGENLGNGGTRSGVTAFGDMNSIDGIDSEIVGDVFVDGVLLGTFNFLFGWGLRL